MAPANNISPAGGRFTLLPPSASGPSVRPSAVACCFSYMDVQTCKDHSIDKGEEGNDCLFALIRSRG